MRDLFRPDDRGFSNDAAGFAVGALAGLTVGFIVSRVFPGARPSGWSVGERARGAVRRLRPARLERLTGEVEELEALEDAVLNRFLSDDVLGNRAIDVGAISPGIVELSGTVATDAEAERAVAEAHAVAGVHSVVNRIDVRGLAPRREAGAPEPGDSTFIHEESRVGGMGRRRQSPETDPGRPDDSQKLREDALAAADRDQWRDEGFAQGSGVTDERPEPVNPPPGFGADEMDNQDPRTLREPGGSETRAD